MVENAEIALDAQPEFAWRRADVPTGIEDLTGLRSGMLEVLWATRDERGRLKWMCRCDCGNEKPFLGYPIRTGALTACGCRRVKDPAGVRKTRLYRIWRNMMNRCGRNGRERYAGRGITVCSDWQTYDRFAEWANENGYQDGLSIDRRDNDLGYDEGNCHWTNAQTQARNTGRTVWVHLGGVRMSLPEAAEKVGVDYGQVYRQMRKRGLSFAEATAHVRRSPLDNRMLIGDGSGSKHRIGGQAMTGTDERQARIAAMSDQDLRRAYIESDAEAGDPEQDALADEIERRGLDV